MSAKRLRVFAGPNGSGKTTIVNKLRDEIPFGVYVNADDIEKSLKIGGGLSFDNYLISPTQQEFIDFFNHSTLFNSARNEILSHFSIDSNVLLIDCEIDSYIASIVSDFIRCKLLENNISLTFETVMSHISKVEFMQKACECGYRVYLYYIATEDYEINQSRVSVRVAQNGHFVPPEKVKDRYFRSLSNLKEAVKHTHRAYMFDNSGNASIYVGEVTDAKNVSLADEYVPNWLYNNLFAETP